MPLTEDVPEALPLFLPVVDYEGDVGVGEDVADAFEVGDGGALGLLVEDAVEAIAVVVEADGYEVGHGLGVGGGEVCYSLGVDGPFFCFGEVGHARLSCQELTFASFQGAPKNPREHSFECLLVRAMDRPPSRPPERRVGERGVAGKDGLGLRVGPIVRENGRLDRGPRIPRYPSLRGLPARLPGGSRLHRACSVVAPAWRGYRRCCPWRLPPPSALGCRRPPRAG